MTQLRFAISIVALCVAASFPCALAHGHDVGGTAPLVVGAHDAHDISTHRTMPPVNASTSSSFHLPESYFTYPEFASLMLAHIVLMSVAWFFVLPVGVVLSIAGSRLALVVQLSFLALHSIGLLLGSIYTYNTPQLYENNSHRKAGWIVTWIVAVQSITGIVNLAINISKGEKTVSGEDAALLPAPARDSENAEDPPNMGSDFYEYPNDSGHFTASNSSRNYSVSSAAICSAEGQQSTTEHSTGHGEESDYDHCEKWGLPVNLNHSHNHKLKYLARKLFGKVPMRMIEISWAIHSLIDRTILLMGFVTFVTGAAVYGGVFRGNNIYNDLAHSVKGGIFFWYGLLTLGRWMGCFVEYGWAWSIRPPVGLVSARKARIPSAEFVESFVIFLYGSTNVFLEHLAAWGHVWSPMDLEHLAITLMFFGGGLCGMLVESTRVRDMLNSVVLTMPAARGQPANSDKLAAPKNYSFSLNPFPGLVIFLLGLMMSSHHQHSMVSATIHKQWGTLFIGFALARAVTYIIIYISPPSSYLPSRPPSELISAFCLISGGLIFMASNRDTVNALERYGVHAMFPFTVTMGFTAFLMAWTIMVLAIKGWAVWRNQSHMPDNATE